MQQLDTTPLDAAGLKAFQAIFADRWGGAPMVNWADLIGGQQLAATLLPPSVYPLLIRSLECIPVDDGLRIRLCRDSALVDRPWECLSRPNVAGSGSAAGYLVCDKDWWGVESERQPLLNPSMTSSR